MKSKMFKKLMAGVLTMTMTAGLAACGGGSNESTESANASASNNESKSQESTSSAGSSEASTSEDETSPYPILKDANGNVYDLGGMEIIIRDWWTDPEAPTVNVGEYAEAQEEWREWIQETYNFKIVQKQISGWGEVPQDFTDYVTQNGDENNYVFIMREDPSLTSQINKGMMYDLATLDCLDFSSEKLSCNGVAQAFTKGNSIYAMYDGPSEPRGGVYFNKRLLEEIGMTADELYDLQKNKQWTWDKMEEIMAKVQRDIDGDGVYDVFGCNCNNGGLVNCAIYSNNGKIVGKDADGKYTYCLEDANTMQAIEWADKIYRTYWETPDDAWDQYKESFTNGKYLFMFEEAWAGQANSFVPTMTDDWGFLMFPMGPQADDYVMKASNNPVVIPSCYDADRAWKIAFAWNLYTDTVPGFEGENDAWQAGYQTFDSRAINESLGVMRMKGVSALENIIPDLDATLLLWNVGPNGKKPSELVEGCRDNFKAAIDAANNQ